MMKKYVTPLVDTYPCEVQQVLAGSGEVTNVVTNMGDATIGYGGSSENATKDTDGNVIVRGNSSIWDSFDN